MISIVTVNWWAADWLDLLIRSAKKYTKSEYQIVVVDNSGELEATEDGPIHKLAKPDRNEGHGPALDFAVGGAATGDFVMVMDVDAHFLLPNWDEPLIAMLEQDANLQLIACQGGLLKPVRPCGMFFRRDFFTDEDMSFRARNLDGAKDDVGIHFYRKTLSIGAGVEFLPWVKKQHYENVVGSEYALPFRLTKPETKPMIYHNYYGTCWYNQAGEIAHRQIGKMSRERFEQAKQSLFKQVDF